SGSLEHAADATDRMIQNRGLGTVGNMRGVGMQLEELGNLARDSQLYDFANKYRAGMQGFTQAQQNAKFNFNNQSAHNAQALVEWLIRTGQFNKAKPGGGV